jgi:hypothetical protein
MTSAAQTVEGSTGAGRYLPQPLLNTKDLAGQQGKRTTPHERKTLLERFEKSTDEATEIPSPNDDGILHCTKTLLESWGPWTTGYASNRTTKTYHAALVD